MDTSRVDEPWRTFYLVAARVLTLVRLASIPLFLVLLVDTPPTGAALWRLSLLLLYGGITLSDFYDGRLARKAGAPSHAWGQMDAIADIAFTTVSLAAAAWLGRVGFWVPAGVAILGGRFVLRNLGRPPAPTGRLREDRAGKAAGVIYYLLVGAITLDVAVGSGRWSQWSIARVGDVVFFYTLWLLLRRRPPAPGSAGHQPGSERHAGARRSQDNDATELGEGTSPPPAGSVPTPPGAPHGVCATPDAAVSQRHQVARVQPLRPGALDHPSLAWPPE